MIVPAIMPVLTERDEDGPRPQIVGTKNGPSEGLFYLGREPTWPGGPR